MEIITIPQLRLASLQTLTESSLDLAKPFDLLADPVAKVEATFERYKKGMQKEKTASEKKTYDKTRDALLSGFLMAVKAEEYYPSPSDQVTDNIKQLKKSQITMAL
ncbi:MAG: hypothetical protein WBA74_13350 [Cyclobacteriaceae bacterium]